MSNVLVVGDIHGCFDNLLSLIKARQKKTRLDAVIVCGDYGTYGQTLKRKKFLLHIMGCHIRALSIL